MNSVLLLLILGIAAFVIWKKFFSAEEKTDIPQHYRIVQKKIPVRGHQRKKSKKRGRSKRK